MGRTKFALGFRSLVALLVPFKRGGTKRAKKFLAMKVELIANFSATMVTSVKGETKSANFWQGKCKLIANCANFWQANV